MILKHTKEWEVAKAAIATMHAWFKLRKNKGAVQWIQDTDGMVVVFTRGEYREAMMNAINENRQPVERFELENEDTDTR